MSDNGAAAHDSLSRQLAAVNCITPIVDSIRKMRVRASRIRKLLAYFATQPTS